MTPPTTAELLKKVIGYTIGLVTDVIALPCYIVLGAALGALYGCVAWRDDLGFIGRNLGR